MSEVLPLRPPEAAIAWVYKNVLYVQYPTPSGEPYVCRYPATIENLASALNILVEHSARSAPPRQETHSQVKVAKPREAVGTPQQRSATRDLLKKLGFIG